MAVEIKVTHRINETASNQEPIGYSAPMGKIAGKIISARIGAGQRRRVNWCPSRPMSLVSDSLTFIRQKSGGLAGDGGGYGENLVQCEKSKGLAVQRGRHSS